jgi:hypothetical protein
MKRIIFFSLLAAATILALTLLATDEVQAGGSKGLRVFLTVDTNLAGQPVEIDTYQFEQFIVTHESYMDNGITEIELNYNKGEVVNGEFELCVYAMTANMEKCAFGYDGEEKAPVYVTVDLYGSFAPQPIENNQGNSQSQASSNNNENNNALSQSQETKIYIRNDGECKKQ